MAWVELRMNVMGEEQVARAFETSARLAEDMSTPLADVGEQVRLSVSEQFRTEGAHGLGQRWKRLNDAYATWKRQQVGDQPILVFDGHMRSTLTSRRAITVTPKRMVYHPVGPHDDIAALHHVGEGVPERKIVAITELEKRQWERIFHEWLVGDVLRRF